MNNNSTGGPSKDICFKLSRVMRKVVSMSRPLIREPGLIGRWKSGDRRKAECQSCNRCFMSARAGNGIFCEMKNSGGEE